MIPENQHTIEAMGNNTDSQKTISPFQRIGIVTSCPEKLVDYFPTTAEPNFIPTEVPFTPDDQLLVDELRRRGHQVSAVVWGSKTCQLEDRFDFLIIRSPWDYMDSNELRQRFLRWLEDLAATRMVVENELPVVLWLMDKSYLLDFSAVGIPIVPTHVIKPGDLIDLAAFVRQHGAAIIKPAVSAAGVGVEFLPDCTVAGAFQQEFEDRCQRGAQLVQPFIPEIQTNGEWSLVYFRGEYSHGVHKVPARGRIMVHAERGGSLEFAEPPFMVRQAADQAAAAFPQAFAHRGDRTCRMPLYLRIDIIETAAGALLSECEGVEPELFFRAKPGSAARFAELSENSLVTLQDRKG